MPRLNQVDRRLAYVAGVRKGSEGREGRPLIYPPREARKPMIELFFPVGVGGGVPRIFTDGDDRMWANIKTRKNPWTKN